MPGKERLDNLNYYIIFNKYGLLNQSTAMKSDYFQNRKIYCKIEVEKFLIVFYRGRSIAIFCNLSERCFNLSKPIGNAKI